MANHRAQIAARTPMTRLTARAMTVLAGGAVVAAGALAGTPSAEAATGWDKVAACESGGNWKINTGNGYYGGLQFSKSSWRAAGGTKYASMPHQATRAQQIATAENLMKMQGRGAWPHCGKHLSGKANPSGAAAAAKKAPSTPKKSAAPKKASASKASAKLAVDGKLGPKTITELQRELGVPRTGKMDRTTRVAMQRWVGASPDGKIGPKSMRALQSKVGAKHNGARGIYDRATVRSLQTYLNTH